MLLCIQINPPVTMQDAEPPFLAFSDHNITLHIFPLWSSQTTMQKHEGFAHVTELKMLLCHILHMPSTHWHVSDAAAQLCFPLFKISDNGEFIDSLQCSARVLNYILSQKKTSLDTLLETLTSRARNCILLCRTEKSCAKTPFAAVSINTHSSHFLSQPSL